MDLFFDGEAFTSEQIAALKRKVSGGMRLLICYMSIGEAENYRYYWQNTWVREPPSWLWDENPDWEGNFKVAYWAPGWKLIIFGEEGSYLDRIIGKGFNGVYLDIIDAFEYFED